MAKSNSTTTAPYTPTHCPKTGRKFTKDERRANNKAKWLAEQAAKSKAKSKTKPKTKSKPAAAAPEKTIKVEAVKGWMADNPKRKQFTAVDITDWMALKGNTKTGKRLANKGKIDSQMSKRNNKLESQAQRKGGTIAA